MPNILGIKEDKAQDMTQTIPLLSCPVPWCDGKASEPEQTILTWKWYISCDKCDCRTEYHNTIEDAQKQWNESAQRVYQPVGFETLTPSQCRAILKAKTRWNGSLQLPLFRDGGKLVQSLIECGMAAATYNYVILSPAGLEARARLINED